MIRDYWGNPTYADKPYITRPITISPELRRLYSEMEANKGRFALGKPLSFFPTGYPRSSPGWN